MTLNQTSVRKAQAYLVENHLTLAEIVILIGGIWLTIVAIDKNTESNLVAARAQLYETEHIVLGREYEEADGTLLSMYAKPSDSIRDPSIYAAERLRPLVPNITPAFWTAKDENGKPRDRVDVLYDKFYGLEAFSPEAGPAAIKMRKMYAHMGTVLDHMHSAYDFDQAISDPEFATWMGYISDIGAHPVFIATVKSWREQGYLSHHFAEFLQSELRRDPLNRSVIDHFYPGLKEKSFLEGLPVYGKRRLGPLHP